MVFTVAYVNHDIRSLDCIYFVSFRYAPVKININVQLIPSFCNDVSNCLDWSLVCTIGPIFGIRIGQSIQFPTMMIYIANRKLRFVV